VSDTPRTDEQINGKPCTRFEILAGDSLRNAAVPSEFARQLERELNAANEMFRKLNLHTLNLTDRIKRLEEALEATAKVIGPPGKSTWVSDDELNHAWELYIKAKEAKL
jgi:predicted nuclease with TOPRIM domain